MINVATDTLPRWNKLE